MLFSEAGQRGGGTPDFDGALPGDGCSLTWVAGIDRITRPRERAARRALSRRRGRERTPAYDQQRFEVGNIIARSWERVGVKVDPRP
jgi:hypothetical protein